MSVVQLESVGKSFMRRDGEQLEVLRNIDLDVPERSIVALVGASGCGKSTLLNIVAGLIPPDQGAVFLNGQKSSAFKDWRTMTYMFQEDRLFPWRTTAQNVALGLEAAGLPRKERRERVMQVLELVGLEKFADSFPHELSGGMRSRAALGRSLVTEPSILLMDEPFSKLDPSIRTQMHDEVLRIAALRQMSVLFVTHDVEEAVVLANKIVVLMPRPGRVKETREIALPYPRNPLSPEVAEEVRLLRLSL
ncbi:ABC transporter ATP-binding protein [Xanthobacter flavus]|uniref:ABC transporter ATP-binding protein n=1 Tax=Xanthobacter flavus TaxID=281 RepID=UPI001AE5B7E9|nr:NitT/TauT family transport system ATP-binding protein [Xanthobacter flavus]